MKFLTCSNARCRT